MWVYMLPVILLSGLLAEACVPMEQYDLTCAKPFLEWEREGILYQEICSNNTDGNGTIVFECMASQQVGLYCVKNSTADELFRTIFEGLDYNISIICEIDKNQTCSNKRQCFADSLNFDNSDDTVVGFYNFFCGADYLQKGYACLDDVACPYTSSSALQSLSFQFKEELINLEKLKQPLQSTCSQLTNQDRTCITTNASFIADCGITTSIKTVSNESVLSCNATDKSSECVKEHCSVSVSNLFLNMSGLLKCSEKLACARVFEYNTVWDLTLAGEKIHDVACQGSYSTGVLNRTCLDTGIWSSVENKCQLNDDAVKTLYTELNNLLKTPSSLNETESIKILNGVTEVVENGEKIQQNNLENTVRLEDLIVSSIEKTGQITEEVLESLVSSFDALLNPAIDETWTDINNDTDSSVKPSWILDMSKRLIAVVQNQSNPNISKQVIQKKFIYIATKEEDGDIVFPSSEDQRMTTSINLGSAKITIPFETLRKKGLSGNVSFGGSYLTTLGQTLEKNKYDNGTIVDINGTKDVNTDVISIQIKAFGSLTELDPPLSIKIKPKMEGYEEPECVYWDFDLTLPGSSSRGAWSGRGCQVISHNSSEVICLCDHLTNFAVLMSPKAVAVAKVLNIISAVGCAISILCLLLTIICHMVVWRMIRSDRATILMNLCIALLLALVTFIVGINRVESRTACAVIAAIIQFLFLAVFFLMFLMGIEILICVVHVFGTKFRIKLLLPLMWGAAALVVGVSLGVTKTEGYGNDKFCWLETESGLIWAFIGPAAFVVFANFIVIAVVFKKMSSSTVLKSKTSKEKAITTAKSLCVLLPLMGVTWVFGLLAVNRDAEFFAYIFCIVNSLQGLFIFLFHCVFNRQIKDAWKHKQGRRKSLQTFSSDFKNRSAIKKRHDSEEHSSTAPPRRELIKEGDWERSERKKYHKHVRRGNILK